MRIRIHSLLGFTISHFFKKIILLSFVVKIRIKKNKNEKVERERETETEFLEEEREERFRASG